MYSRRADCWVAQLSGYVEACLLMCQFHPVVLANFKAFGDFDFVKLATRPSCFDLGKIAALFLLAASSSQSQKEIVAQIMAFPEQHQANLQLVLKYAFTEKTSTNYEADLEGLNNLASFADDFLDLYTEHDTLKDSLARSEVTATEIEADLGVKKGMLNSLKDEISALNADLASRDKEITALKRELECQEQEFQEIMVELKEELDAKDELLQDLQLRHTPTNSTQLKLQGPSRLARKLEEARSLNETLIEALKSRDSELENSVRMKGLLDYLNTQLHNEKATTARLSEEVERLVTELDEITTANAVLVKANKDLYRAKRMTSKRVKHLSQQVEYLNSRSLNSSEDEGENLQEFTIEQNKQMEEQLINCKTEVNALERKLTQKTRALASLRTELARMKQGLLTDTQKRPTSICMSANEPLSAGHDSAEVIIDVENISEGAGMKPKTLGRAHFRAKSLEYAINLRHLKVDETLMLRERLRHQNATISHLLNEESSLLVALEHLSETNKTLMALNETFKVSLEAADLKLKAEKEARQLQAIAFERELNTMSMVLAAVEQEVRGARQRFSVT